MRATPARVEVLPAPVDLILYRGDSFTATFQLRTGGQPVDLSGSLVSASVNYPDGRWMQDMDATVIEVGTVQITLTAGQTLALGGGVGVWDLQVVTGPEVRTWIRGRVSIAQDVTR